MTLIEGKQLIELALSNRMSPVMGKWIIGILAEMTEKQRNSPEWHELLQTAANTGRGHEAERSSILLDWMWDVVLPLIQFLGDRYGFGAQWKAMSTDKTGESARIAAVLADAGCAPWMARAATAASVGDAGWAAHAVKAALGAEAVKPSPAGTTVQFMRAATTGASVNREYKANQKFWENVAPAAVLRRLIDVENYIPLGLISESASTTTGTFSQPQESLVLKKKEPTESPIIVKSVLGNRELMRRIDAVLQDVSGVLIDPEFGEFVEVDRMLLLNLHTYVEEGSKRQSTNVAVNV